MSKELPVEYETVRMPQQLDPKKAEAQKNSANIKAYVDELCRTQAAEVQGAQEANQRALRYNEGKPRWFTLVPFKDLQPMLDVLEYGAKKYAPKNWEKGLSLDSIMDSMIRHIVALQSGEDIDPESGLPHIGHVQCNSLFYSHFYLQQKSEKKATNPVKEPAY